MKKFLIVLVIVLAAFLAYKFAFQKKKPAREKPVPVAVSTHSEGFNKSVDAVLKRYFEMTDGFVNWDSAVVNAKAAELQQALESFDLEDLKKDSIIYQTALFPLENCKGSAATIATSGDWTEKRRELQNLSDNLRMLLITVKFDQKVVYWNECPMAFGEGQIGNWLSEKDEIVNPYLGKKDPKYGASMLSCGENKMKIDFTQADSAKGK
ncbi:MAG: DUF3347 domain-containing protein [Niabella sp.]